MRHSNWFHEATATARSRLAAYRASALLGRTLKLRRENRPDEALGVARKGLHLLAAPGVQRHHGPEGSVLLGLTINAEELAQECGQPGADEDDIRDSYHFLRGLHPGGSEAIQEMHRRWLPYFEARLADRGRS